MARKKAQNLVVVIDTVLFIYLNFFTQDDKKAIGKHG
jgi:hypothetical protein